MIPLNLVRILLYLYRLHDPIPMFIILFITTRRSGRIPHRLASH